MASILHWASAFAVMRRIIRSRDGRPYRRRPLRTPLPVRRALVWQQDRWPVQLIPSTLWLGPASNPSARACDHVQRWSQSLTSNYRYAYKSAQVWHGGPWTKLLRRARKSPFGVAPGLPQGVLQLPGGSGATGTADLEPTGTYGRPAICGTREPQCLFHRCRRCGNFAMFAALRLREQCSIQKFVAAVIPTAGVWGRGLGTTATKS